MTKMLKVAVLACDLPDGVSRQFRGKSHGISKILRMRLHEIAKESQLQLTTRIFPIPRKQNDFPDPVDFQAIIISGSMSDISNQYLLQTTWMKRLLDFIRDAHEEIPMLGICFGHQAIARAFDSHLEDLYIPEEGFYPVNQTPEAKRDPLFASVPERFMALFSHSQYITPAPGATLVMGDSPSVQAFRVGKSTWGLQFHPDFSPETVKSALISRRKDLEHRMDVDKALHRLDIKDEERDDTKPLINFVKLAAGLL